MSDAANIPPGQPGLPNHYQSAATDHPGGQTFDSDTNGTGGGIGVGLPALLALGGGIAALWLIEAQTKALSRGAHYVGDQAHDLYDDAGDWLGETAHDVRDKAAEWADFSEHGLLAAGAKAAGVVGLLKALGNGELSTGATRAAKALAAKKLASYAAGAGKRVAKVAAKHPKSAAAATAAGVKARNAAKEQADRARRAYRSYRGEPEPQESSFGTGGAVLALTVLGLGAGAAYLFSQSHPDAIAKAKQKAGRYGGRATDIARDAYSAAAQAGASLGEHGGDYVHAAARAVGLESPVPMNDEQLVSRVRRAVGSAVAGDISDVRIIAHDGNVTLSGKLPAEGREAALSAVRDVPGVKDVKIETDAGATA